MNQFTAGFLASLIANGLTTIIKNLLSKSFKPTKKGQDLIAIVVRDATLISILQKATASLARKLKGIPDSLNDRIKAFLVSPDIDAITRQIYSTKLGSSDIISDRSQLKKEFLVTLQLYLGDKFNEIREFSEILFNSLIDGCDRALDIAIDNGFLSAHEAKSAMRANLIIGELRVIKANLKFLNQVHLPDQNEIEVFEEKLRSQIADRHGFIVPPHFDSRRRIPIDDLYVVPTLNFSSKKSNNHNSENNLSVDYFMSFLFRAVILGNPGSGKSTLANRICSSLVSNKADRSLGGRRITPILVILREYGRAKKERGLSILQFLNELISSTYQIPPPNHAIERLLMAGRIFIIFDGLDELLDTSYRHQVSSDVESFASFYSKAGRSFII